jgi:putative membrane protein
MHLLLVWLIWAVAIWLTAKLLPGFEVPDFGSAIVVALVFGLVNAVLGHFLYLLIGVSTLGVGFLLGFLTRLVVTAIVLKVTDAFTDSLTIRGFGTALVAAGAISFFGSVGEHLLLHGARF